MTTTWYSSDAVTTLSDSATASDWSDYVITALGDYAGDYDIAAFVAEYTSAIGKLLPKGYTIAGNFIFRDAFVPLLTDEQLEDLRDAIADIPFWVIAAKHEIAK